MNNFKIFKIDNINKTTSLFTNNKYLNHLIVPRTFKHESTDYIIACIKFGFYHAKKIIFVEDYIVNVCKIASDLIYVTKIYSCL